ncbi:MAG: bifunctional [glutamate--ammonia ligase]-adenylyl-L-tyrosine phosphorylase/[glutamate--ammonia-ligase] adenylyltransferase, partial [Gammaproteobacteria bacterium]
MSEGLAAASDSSALFAGEVGAWWQQMQSALGPRCVAMPGLSRVLACSPFVANYLARDPARWVDLVESGDLSRGDAAGGYRQAVDALLAEASDEPTLKQRLRRFRNREMVRIAWRDIAGLADLDATLRDLSALADALVDASYRWWYERLCATLGVPLGEGGDRQAMVVIAMGKLGALELNFSSDIDLIFAYPEAGETRGTARTVSNQEFFTRLGQSLIKSLADVTEDGFVFRVDMRLRPFGESGPLVASFETMEAYYVTHGREWERYALIKARIAAGDQAAGARLLAMLKPFVYRRYLDFTAIGALRDMKRLIDQEVEKKGLADNIKLGRGGIREVEFIGQVFQLIRGGRNAVLQTPAIRTVLGHLRQLGYLPEAAVAELCSAYSFLRTLENRLQQIGDQQTQSLPDTEIDRARIACGMGYASWEAFLAELAAHRERVHRHFAALLRDDKTGTHRGTGAPWPGIGEASATRQWLAGVGYSDPEAASEVLARHAKSMAGKRLSQTERARLERVFPRVLQAAAGRSDSVALLDRVLPIVETVARRSVYLVLLEEHPEALAQLIRLCAASPWIAKRIEQRPILLDELIDPRLLYNPPAPEALDAELERQLAGVAPGDLEREMDVLRHFKHSQLLRVAAADVAGALLLRVVSDHLTAIAESVLRATLRLARAHLQRRFGEPYCIENGVRRRAGFIIVAYGKLGGFELGYGSDLDLV